MATQYQQIMAFPMVAGDEVTLHGAKWVCVIACTVVGVTLDHHLPVVKGPLEPRLNNGDLRLGSEPAAQGKPGQVPIEVATLRPFTQIGPNDIEEIEGQRILHWKFDTFGGFLVMFEGGTYLKMDLTSGYDGPELSMEDLTMGDLNSLDWLPPGVWDKYLAQKKLLRNAQSRNSGEIQLGAAIDELGIDRVRELVSKTMPEN